MGEAEALGARARACLGDAGASAGLSHTWAEPASAIPAAVRRARPSLLVLGLEVGDEASGQLTIHVLKAVNCPLLIVP